MNVSDAGGEVLDFLQTLLQPFIDSYRVILTQQIKNKNTQELRVNWLFGYVHIQVVFRYLCEDGHRVLSERQLLPSVRKLATELILSGALGSV